MTTTPHPAKFSDTVLDAVTTLLHPYAPLRILDPFAGVGKVHRLDMSAGGEHMTYGVEIEPEWASQHERTVVGNALDLPFTDGFFEGIVVSPCYGNRMADHHNARDDTRRHTYKHYLGRDLHSDNSGQLQWGPTYRRFHRAAWREATRVLAPDGLFCLNISDHIRGGVVIPVSRWHVRTLQRLGYMVLEEVQVETPRQGMGANREARVGYESVVLLARLADPA